jgi:hypothetical protein
MKLAWTCGIERDDDHKKVATRPFRRQRYSPSMVRIFTPLRAITLETFGKMFISKDAVAFRGNGSDSRSRHTTASVDRDTGDGAGSAPSIGAAGKCATDFTSKRGHDFGI